MQDPLPDARKWLLITALLVAGDAIEFNGIYEWNDKGGVLHWTHHDPSGRHAPGWLKHNGRTCQ